MSIAAEIERVQATLGRNESFTRQHEQAARQQGATAPSRDVSNGNAGIDRSRDLSPVPRPAILKAWATARA